uniref:Uncharacterized protein n=1 Tax=Anguilla anguilla TaxID=7936 RepID=A0A0E9WYD3_ANGAN
MEILILSTQPLKSVTGWRWSYHNRLESPKSRLLRKTFDGDEQKRKDNTLCWGNRLQVK